MSIETLIQRISFLKVQSAEVIHEIALLKLLVMAREDMASGRVQPLAGLKERVRKRAQQ
ncbi:MAG: hypothetical protein ABI673_02520 [Novosphingobium sp.]